jgi:hypothetical protein
MAAMDREVPIAMRSVYRRLEDWRRTRTGRERIPEALWAAAGELAREHGVNQVSRVLRLEFNHLKRMAARITPNGRGPTPAFVELIAPQTAGAPQCVIELEGQRGKVRIEWKGTATELAAFSRALWEMVS